MTYKYKIFHSSDTNVSKYVFEKQDIAVEAVLYKYESYKKRTVLCCSTQCGCPVGCVFCGTGKFFKRNLTVSEIVEQVEIALSHIDCDTSEIEKFQIMFMSMGEPFLNYVNLEKAIKVLNASYPNAQLLVSTSSPNTKQFSVHFEKFIELSNVIDKIGIQFSVHESTDDARKKLIPSSTQSLSQIGHYGEQWARSVNRKPFFNYCVHDKNASTDDALRLAKIFNPDVWECTLSVICEKDQSMKSAIQDQLNLINRFSIDLKNLGFSLRVFNPAGQDDIGGGCGQLWYFQEWLNNN